MAEAGERPEEAKDPSLAETVVAKPAEVDYGEFFAIGKKLGIEKQALDTALLISGRPQDKLGARQILLHEQDFIRAFEFMMSYQFGRGNVDGAYDAQLGFINQIASLSHYSPSLRLDSQEVERVNGLRDDISFLSSVELAEKTRTLTMSLIESYEKFLDDRGYDASANHIALLLELRREYKRRIDALMMEVKVAIQPLASSRRNQQTSEPGKDLDQSQSEPATDVGSLALGAVAGTRPPRDSKPDEQ